MIFFFNLKNRKILIYPFNQKASVLENRVRKKLMITRKAFDPIAG